MTKAVGFDQKIQLHQLNFAAQKYGQVPIATMHSMLDDYLMQDIAGAGSRRCAHAIIMKIWWSVEEEYAYLRDYIASQYNYLVKEEKDFVHWCMTCLAYPFFRLHINHLGKHFRLADEVRSRTILSEMKNVYGDRRRIEVATGAVFSTIKHWGFVQMNKPGVYSLPEKRIEIVNPILKMLLIEVLMNHYDTNALTLETVNNSAIFFPFDYHVGIGDLDKKRFTTFSTVRDTVLERNTQIPYSTE